MYLRYDQFIGISIRSPVTETALNWKPSFQRTGIVNVSVDDGAFSPLQMRMNSVSYTHLTLPTIA